MFGQDSDSCVMKGGPAPAGFRTKRSCRCGAEREKASIPRLGKLLVTFTLLRNLSGIQDTHLATAKKNPIY